MELLQCLKETTSASHLFVVVVVVKQAVPQINLSVSECALQKYEGLPRLRCTITALIW